jgi:predicted MFS family arabinose efflux permease
MHSPNRRPPDPGRAADNTPGRSSIPVVIGVGAAVALSLFGDMAMYVILPVRYAELGFTAIQVGIVLSANRWIRLITNRVAERLIHRFGTSFLFPASLLVGSLLAAAYALQPGFALLLLLRMAWGVCWSFIRHTGVMTTVRIAGSGRAGRHMGVYAALLQGGFVAGTFAAGLLFDAVGFRTTFLLAAAFSLAAVPTAVAVRRRTSTGSSLPGHTGPTPLRRHILLLSLRGFIVSLVGAGLVMSTLGYLLRVRVGDSLALGGSVIGVATITGTLLALHHFIGGVGSPLFGAVVDRVGTRWTQIGAFAMAGASMVALAITGSLWLLFPLVVLFFVGAAASRLAVEAQAAVAGPRAYADLVTAMDFGSAAGPLLGWLGIELTQSTIVFWGGGALLLIAALLAGVQRPAVRETGVC